jgi:hypothetical protein
LDDFPASRGRHEAFDVEIVEEAIQDKDLLRVHR